MIKKREFDDAAGREFEGLGDDTIRPGITAFLGGTLVGALARLRGSCVCAEIVRVCW